MKTSQIVTSLLEKGFTISEVARTTGLDRRRVQRIRDGVDVHRGRVGRPPYPPAVRQAIRQKLAGGSSIRQVAQEVGVSIAMVARIKTPTSSPPRSVSTSWHESEIRHGIRRCPRCGGMIIVSPCRVCRVRDLQDIATRHL